MNKTKGRVSAMVLGILATGGILLAGASAASAYYYSDDVSFGDSGCNHYGFSRYDSNKAPSVVAFTMNAGPSGGECNFNKTAVHYLCAPGSYTSGYGVVYAYGGFSHQGGKHSGGVVYKCTYLPMSPR